MIHVSTSSVSRPEAQPAMTALAAAAIASRCSDEGWGQGKVSKAVSGA